MNDDDDLLFDDDNEGDGAVEPAAPPWKIMIVDDDAEVHAVTRMVLGDVSFLGRRLTFVGAHSAAEAMRILPEHPDTAIILLDVVMESDDAGLRVVRHVRETLHWSEVRIILRTGQPGVAPERAVIVDYDINDYKAKTELTDTKLFTAVIAALRSYRDLVSLETSRLGLRKIIDAAASLHRSPSLHLFANGVLTQLNALITTAGGGILCTQKAGDGEVEVLASSGRFGEVQNGPARDHLAPDLFERLRQTLESGESQYGDGCAMLHLRTPNRREVVVYVEVNRPLTEIDRSLIAIFGNNISIGFDNLEAHERLVEANRALERRLADCTRALHACEARLDAGPAP